MNREKALKLLKKYNKEEYHVRHGLMVEAIMRYIAQDYGYDKDFWGIAGQLHDVDYEMYPEEHCVKCIELLKKLMQVMNLFMLYVAMGMNYAVMLNLLILWKKFYIHVMS